MVTFRQKIYNSSTNGNTVPKTQPGGWPRGSSVINSGGTDGTKTPSQPSQKQALATAALGQQADIQRQKTLRDLNIANIRRSRYEGIQGRAEASNSIRLSIMNSAKKQASVSGAIAAKVSSRNPAQSVANYKTPTRQLPPIADKKKKD